ncbi:ABC transporter permease [Rhizobium leguminosarum]|uniref:ABC transporter permease n=1 Tax=Rhizobium TaxID=379 RepID=UPI00143FB6E4|nr:MULTISPECIES: ABC transporter permease [Rhizobium]MBY3252513.1 ABC transporter permease [Rhizobium laguerreae]MBY5840882.1 ABC transporter permease [Rhizobium leguminosarum]MBY5869157.1 ABC transporter permease [Rhizobium leguminosarum]NKK78020.1 ABC transporter permease subunit [Rhizobium leguminosarum bv. viciae]NKL08779.1 ABC transporter permease subunit [Rhizobium leguminosarum bv. viciae]
MSEVASEMALAVEKVGFARRLGVHLSWRSTPVIFSVVVILGFIAVAVTIPLWSPYDPVGLAGRRLQPPSATHWIGTDALGRDVLTRTLWGTRYSLPIAALVLGVGVSIGVLVGAVAGFVGGIVDNVLMRLADITLAFPPILLAMAIAASLGPGLVHTAIALIIVWWPIYARLMRAQVLNIKQLDHVDAAIVSGAHPLRVLSKHIIPLCWSPILVNATMDVGQVILLASGLSFVGLGAQPPTPEWGQMIAEGASNFYSWWIAFGAGLAIFLLSLCFNFLGDGMRDLLDPHERAKSP